MRGAGGLKRNEEPSGKHFHRILLKAEGRLCHGNVRAGKIL